MDQPWRQVDGFVELFVKLTPKASKNAIIGMMAEADGTSVLKISVTAIPENNKANLALIVLLSKKLHIPKSNIHIKMGLTNTRKIIQIYGVEVEKVEEKLFGREL
ncbi:DUF167 domain-containing protein [Candidatus Paracaedibacter symbiosus]|uniref:DUF167 domain-containing protein n=1 Tax=Candidatus Paracaedibacter symbiosus TaxID=244582 RepID=UPI000509D91B|nr:DUF167 family protein [Candidatus Paracaedibacter symbiosus]